MARPKLFHLMSELGTRDALAYGLDRIFSALPGTFGLFSFTLMCQPLDRLETSGKRPPGRVDYRLIDFRDPMYDCLSVDRSALYHRRKQESQCVGAVRNGEVIGMLWFTDGDFIEDQVRCTFHIAPKGQVVWDFGMEILPQYRLGRVFSQLWRAAAGVMAESGARWTLCRISSYNRPAINAHERLGARAIGKIRFLRLGGVQVMWGNRRPYFNICTAKSKGPDILVTAPDG